jgi:NitT/TauT family transport system substrate-binding protein
MVMPDRRRLPRVIASFGAVAAAALLAAACSSSSSSSSASATSSGGTAGATSAPVSLAIGGDTAIVYLPDTLAASLGYFSQAGLNVSIQNVTSATLALNEVVANKVDVCACNYVYTLELQPEGKDLQAFSVYDRSLGTAIAVAPSEASSIKSVADLKGKTIGTTSLGSSTTFVLDYLLKQAGISPTAVKVTAVGSGAAAVAALEHNQVDAVINGDPTILTLQQDDPGVTILDDTRTEAGNTAAFGSPEFPAQSLVSFNTWISAHPTQVSAMESAIDKSLAYIHSHTAAQVAQALKPAYISGSVASFAKVIQANEYLFATQDKMQTGEPQVVEKFLEASESQYTTASFDLPKTYTSYVLGS